MSNKYPAGITRTPSGDWKIRATAKSPRTGKIEARKGTLEASATLKDAVLKHDELVNLIRSGRRMAAAGKTVSDYAKSWLIRRLPRLESDLTRRRYVEALENHILPDFGDWMVSAIDNVALDEWLVRPRNKYELRAPLPNGARGRAPAPVAPDTVNGWWRILKAMLQSAVHEMGLPRDPTIGVRPLPKRTKIDEETNTLTADEVVRVLRVCRAQWPQWYGFTVLGFAIGARPGELRPIRVGKDLDLDTGKLTIRQSQRQDYLGPTKTKTARAMLLPPEILDVLKQHLAWLKRNGHPGSGAELLFPPMGQHWRTHRRNDIGAAPKGSNKYLGASSFDRPFAAMVHAAGIKRHITPRTFRRTFNDIAREAAGLNNVVTRSLTGHQSIEMQETYSTVDLEEKRAGLAKIISLFGFRENQAEGQVPGDKGQVEGQVEGLSGAIPDLNWTRKEDVSG